MREIGERFASGGVSAVVFVHGTFMGTDPFSFFRVIERSLPKRVGSYVAGSLRKMTRRYVERAAGDLGNFGAAYVRLFEQALRPEHARIPCTEFVWSSENHHLGRLEAALDLVRVLSTHAELGGGLRRRILVIGHSHAGQVFALATQLLARSIATTAIVDVARARGLDVGALEVDLETLADRPKARSTSSGVDVDFVTFGTPRRYAWATLPNVRALHVIAVPPRGSKTGFDGDWVRRLGVEGSDFPPLSGDERRINATLSQSLGHAGFDPTKVAMALRRDDGVPGQGDVAFVEYGNGGLTHGTYTRLDAMLFHARLVADRFFPDPGNDQDQARGAPCYAGESP
jgi:hypothetical protein